MVVAGFATWHESHEAAFAELERRPSLPAHCGLEVFSTLTRLPEPFRAPADTVATFLGRWFAKRWLSIGTADLQKLPARLSRLGIVGGASYDALVAVTAKQHRAELHTLDRWAVRTYDLVGADYQLVA